MEIVQSNLVDTRELLVSKTAEANSDENEKELSRELEEELLCAEDCEEDTHSEGSLQLRLSDDEEIINKNPENDANLDLELDRPNSSESNNKQPLVDQGEVTRLSETNDTEDRLSEDQESGKVDDKMPNNRSYSNRLNNHSYKYSEGNHWQNSTYQNNRYGGGRPNRSAYANYNHCFKYNTKNSNGNNVKENHCSDKISRNARSTPSSESKSDTREEADTTSPTNGSKSASLEKDAKQVLENAELSFENTHRANGVGESEKRDEERSEKCDTISTNSEAALSAASRTETLKSEDLPLVESNGPSDREADLTDVKLTGVEDSKQEQENGQTAVPSEQSEIGTSDAQKDTVEKVLMHTESSPPSKTSDITDDTCSSSNKLDENKINVKLGISEDLSSGEQVTSTEDASLNGLEASEQSNAKLSEKPADSSETTVDSLSQEEKNNLKSEETAKSAGTSESTNTEGSEESATSNLELSNSNDSRSTDIIDEKTETNESLIADDSKALDVNSTSNSLHIDDANSQDESTIEYAEKSTVDKSLQENEKSSSNKEDGDSTEVNKQQEIANEVAVSLDSNQSKQNTDCEDSNLDPRLPAITTEISLSDSNEAFEFTENADSSDADSLSKSIKRRKLSSDALDSDSQPDAELLLLKRKSTKDTKDELDKVSSSDVRDDAKCDMKLKSSEVDGQVSPTRLKRSHEDDSEQVKEKKIKIASDERPRQICLPEERHKLKELGYVKKFFERDFQGELKKLSQEELEELLIQKIVETITMRGEIGKLREQILASEKSQEATREKCKSLTKQVKDFEMVLKRFAEDKRNETESKPSVPIKINRSVGLQVNFVSKNGVQSLRQVQHNMLKSAQGQSTSSPSNEASSTHDSRRGLKVKPPRKPEMDSAQQAQARANFRVVGRGTHATGPSTSTATAISKPPETQRHQRVQQPVPIKPALPNKPMQVISGKIISPVTRQGANKNVNPKSSDLIDLTDEEDKTRRTPTTMLVTKVNDAQSNVGKAGYQRVTLPSTLTVGSPAASIRIVQPNSQPTPAALVNNISAPGTLTYVMPNGVGVPRQLIITSSAATQIRPVVTSTRTSLPTLSYKQGITTLSNGTVKVIPASVPSPVNRYPIPLPSTPVNSYSIKPGTKLPPPAPTLKISKVESGIVLSWNMNLNDTHADIASYQLYAYQEVAGVPPNAALWKKVGDVRALPLPMACTLTQFSEGNNYYFTVRAVDTHTRYGQYSPPSHIAL